MSEHLLSMLKALGTTLRVNSDKVPLPRRALWDAPESTETLQEGPLGCLECRRRGNSEKKAFWRRELWVQRAWDGPWFGFSNKEEVQRVRFIHSHPSAASSPGH